MTDTTPRQHGLSIPLEDIRGALADTARCKSCTAEPVLAVWEADSDGTSYLEWDFCTGHDLDCPVWLANVGKQTDRALRLIIGGEEQEQR
jgi:hypothetical protein